MLNRIKNIWYAYVLYDLPRDFWLALRTRQLIKTRLGWNWAAAGTFLPGEK